MSRIIVKQLPKNITEEKLRSLFGAKGTITDIQLKYTADGKFRQFCFVGFQNEEDAGQAIRFFNNTCIQTNRIRVEMCANLGSEDTSQSWSKHAKDKKKEMDLAKKGNKSLLKEKTQSKFDEIIGKHKEDPEFQEFMKAHETKRSLWANDAAEAVSNITDDKQTGSYKEDNDVEDDFEAANSKAEENQPESETEKLAGKAISDLEYMKSLMVSSADGKSLLKPKQSNIDLYTIKIHNVPYKTKRHDIIKFFKPLKPFSVRLPSKVHGFCYVGFKTEKDMTKAMLRNKSFIKGKQVFFADFTEKNKITMANQTRKDDEIKTATGNNPKWKAQELSLSNEEDISESGKIFFRNLAYTVHEEDLQKLFEQYGPVAELHLPVDAVTRQIKGFGTVTFLMPEHGVQAFNKLDGTTFHGRLLHLIPAKGSSANEEQDNNDSDLTFKQKKVLKLKKAAQNPVNWNTLFLGSNAVAEILAKKFETSKQHILDTNDGGSSAAVRIALGETQVVMEMKSFLEEHGVCISAFDSQSAKRSKTIILAKNLPPATSIQDLKPIFSKFGPISRIVLPPSGVTAIIEYCDPSEAKQAFKKLAYSKFRNVPLYLEWGPEDTFTSTLTVEPLVSKTETAESNGTSEDKANAKVEAKQKVLMDDNEQDDSDDLPEPNTTLFLRNLNFKTEAETVYNHFKSLGTIHTVEIAKRKDRKNPKNFSTLGYGFIQFKKYASADYALKNMQFTKIDGNQIELKRSDRILRSTNNQGQRKTVEVTKQTGTKILVRNIPFQAKVKEVRDIFKAFGELRSVRLPKKMTPGEDSHRGFGFVDFITKSDAKKAFDALSQSTHLYGRRIALEWASTTDMDVNDLRKRAADQLNSIHQSSALKRSKRTIFDAESNIQIIEDEED